MSRPSSACNSWLLRSWCSNMALAMELAHLKLMQETWKKRCWVTGRYGRCEALLKYCIFSMNNAGSLIHMLGITLWFKVGQVQNLLRRIACFSSGQFCLCCTAGFPSAPAVLLRCFFQHFFVGGLKVKNLDCWTVFPDALRCKVAMYAASTIRFAAKSSNQNDVTKKCHSDTHWLHFMLPEIRNSRRPPTEKSHAVPWHFS